MTAVTERARSESPSGTSAGVWMCVGGAAIGALGIIGWISGTPWLVTLVPGLPAMMPNSSLALLLIGAAGAARHGDERAGTRRALANLMAVATLVMGFGTLLEYALALDLRIVTVGQVLTGTQTTLSSGPSSPLTALALTCLAAAVLLINVRGTGRGRPSELLVLGGAFTAFIGLTGIIVGAAPMYRLTRMPLIGLSLPAAASLGLTSLGLLMGPAGGPAMRLAASSGPGGSLIRRLTLPAIVSPVLLGFAVTRLAAMNGSVDVAVPVAILTVTMTAGILILLMATAPALNRAHDAVQASRTEISNLVELAPDGIFVADVDGRYTDVNDAGCQLLGRSRDEIVGKTIIDLIPADDVARLWQTREVLLRGGVDVGEWRLRHKDGSYVPVEVSAKILSDGRWQGFVRDISERKRLAEGLRLSEAKSTGILSISADAIISIDAEQRITQFNEGAERIFGYSKAEALGAPLDMLMPERIRHLHPSHVARFADGTEVARKMGTRDSIIVGRRKNGDEFPADAAISKLEVGGTRVLTVIVRDITEQKAIENEHRLLAEVGAVLTSTLDDRETTSRVAEVSVQDFSDFCLVDLIEGDAGEMRRIAVAGRDRSHNWICDVLLRVPPDQKYPPLVGSVLESQRSVVLERPARSDVERLARDSDDLSALSAIDVRILMVIPLIARGRLLGAITFLSAMSSSAGAREELRIAEEIARQTSLAVDNGRLYHEARRATQVRDDVLGIVAHDLRNPLSVIRMEAEILESRRVGLETGSSPPPEQEIQRAAKRIDRIIQDLLDVTRVEAGRLTLEPRPLNAAQIAAEAAGVQRGLASSASLELRLDLSPELPEVLADRDRLLRVFENLLGNAIKFTPAGGTITVGAARHDGSVCFWVKDTGPGIAVEDQSHLFDRFWQARTTTRHGAGLGLPIVKGIVEAHGGRAWVESAPGSGSTFFFTIPVAPRPQPPDAGLATGSATADA